VPSPLVGVSLLVATVTGDHHVPVLESDPGVAARTEIRVTPVAGKADELPGEREPVAFSDPSSPADVPTPPLLVARDGRFRRERP